MPVYRLAGQDLVFLNPIPDLESYRINETASDDGYLPVPDLDAFQPDLISHTNGWIGDTLRNVDIYPSGDFIFLRVEEVGDFIVGMCGETVGKVGASASLSRFDEEVILGPALVYALAGRNLWSLHASAVMFHETTIAFVGETGTGKSTLAAYLSHNMGWRLVADDILPVTGHPTGLTAWPRFPQLKLPVTAQPWAKLPEHLPLNMICELVPETPDVLPDVRLLPPEKAVRVLLSHTAGTRLFDEKTLEKHLAFCAQAVENVPVYQFIYPHSNNALSKVKELLENLC